MKNPFAVEITGAETWIRQGVIAIKDGTGKWCYFLDTTSAINGEMIQDNYLIARLIGELLLEMLEAKS